MKKILGVVAVILMVVVVAGSAAVYLYLDSFSKKKNTGNEAEAQPKAVKPGKPFNVLILGVDIGTVGSKNGPKRSDTMIIVHYDPNSSEMSMVSIPRDTKVTINGSVEKINAANAYGGTELAVKTVEDLLDIDINYFVEINYEGFRKIIDAMGGIDVVIPYNMNYDDPAQNLHIHFTKGQSVHLNGQKAEEFVRWRKNNNGSGYAEGDLGRIQTQQDFMIKVIEKLKSPSTVLKLPYIMKILPEYVDTNMEPMTMLGLSKDLPKINASSIQKYTLQGDPKYIGGISYIIYKPEKNKEIIAALGIENVSDSTLEVDKSAIKIQILNGSNVNGAASKLRNALKKKGYNVVSIGNISGVDLNNSYIIDKTLKQGNANAVASELDISHIEKKQDKLSKVDILIILGKDTENIIDNI